MNLEMFSSSQLGNNRLLFGFELDTAEKRAFLENGHESVKLTPSWEDRNLPSAELNFKGLESDVDKVALDMDPPPDRYEDIHSPFFIMLIQHLQAK